ncbi:MAG TPA: hypothetical protein VNJ02_04015 [Vicinamibacterales bacterium]|nr:hypothetical protein [Vicinamibacterales bacterium]
MELLAIFDTAGMVIGPRHAGGVLWTDRLAIGMLTWTTLGFAGRRAVEVGYLIGLFG